MASFTGVGDNTTLSVQDRDEAIAIAISGTYDMTILFQREQGSPGSGSWLTLKTYSTANATVADTWYSENFNENYRLIVTVDGGGTATATLSDSSDKTLFQRKDAVGNVLETVKQSGVNFPNSFSAARYEVVDLTSASYTLTEADHAGRLLFLDKSGGIDIDLPAATGSGAVYKFMVVTATADAYAISAGTNGADFFGVVCGCSAGGTEFTWNATANNNTLSLGGTSQATGGSVGDYIEIVDIATNKYHARGFITQGGTPATPFSTV